MGEDSFLFVWIGFFFLSFFFRLSLTLPFLPCEDAWDLQMGKQGISSKSGRHLQSRASGVARSLRGFQREDSFPHSWLFPKEGGKGDKRGEKRSGDSLCICVQYGLF